MTTDQEERLVRAFESIATQLSGIGKTLELTYNRQYPLKREPRDIDMSHIKTPEEELLESQGATGEKTIDDWIDIGSLDIGPRERAFIEKEGAAKAGNRR